MNYLIIILFIYSNPQVKNKPIKYYNNYLDNNLSMIMIYKKNI